MSNKVKMEDRKETTGGEGTSTRSFTALFDRLADQFLEYPMDLGVIELTNVCLNRSKIEKAAFLGLIVPMSVVTVVPLITSAIIFFTSLLPVVSLIGSCFAIAHIALRIVGWKKGQALTESQQNLVIAAFAMLFPVAAMVSVPFTLAPILPLAFSSLFSLLLPIFGVISFIGSIASATLVTAVYLCFSLANRKGSAQEADRKTD